MKHVFGVFPEKKYISNMPLPISSRFSFEDWNTQEGGYFDLIAPFFEQLSIQKCGIGLKSINLLLVISGNELEACIGITNQMLISFSTYEKVWEYYQGSEKAPNQPEKQIYLTLHRLRLMAIIKWLRRYLIEARDSGYCFIFGNGVCYRMLCEIKLPAGTIVYS
ncbi:hypothetical protein [Agitococcus lubricus]|uniref:Uncharacterized protein n=1 Tax=Agitococcus lubricus TaxID=1077255 RepID=A0A2T5IJB4_9GAMM|nr:hypothetical protein [Agitococcus lubricus]PTQ83916.1 hypothetical protein C8N29_1652 [Agitococcus lubricus]